MHVYPSIVFSHPRPGAEGIPLGRHHRTQTKPHCVFNTQLALTLSCPRLRLTEDNAKGYDGVKREEVRGAMCHLNPETWRNHCPTVPVNRSRSTCGHTRVK